MRATVYLMAILAAVTIAGASSAEAPSKEALVEESSFEEAPDPIGADRAKYEAVMAKMQKLKDKLKAKEKMYAERAERAGAQEEVEKKKELKEVAMVDAMMPAAPVSTVAGAALVEEKDTPKDALVEALKHHEVDDIMTEVETEHKAGPNSVLKALQKRQDQVKRQTMESQRDWTALKYGWKPLPGELKPDEAKVKEDAHIIERNLESGGSKHLSQEQKDQILAATREHEATMQQIKLAQLRNKRMKQVVEKDTRLSKKNQMIAEAEKIYAEKDHMDAEVEAVIQEANSVVTPLP
jgi:hypothetical protein